MQNEEMNMRKMMTPEREVGKRLVAPEGEHEDYLSRTEQN